MKFLIWLLSIKKGKYLLYRDIYGTVVSMRIIEESSSYYKIRGRLSSEEELISGCTYCTSTITIPKSDPRIIHNDRQSATVYALPVRLKLPTTN
jgi:hypothetical protein